MAQTASAIIVILFAVLVLLALSIDSLAGWMLALAVAASLITLAALVIKDGGKQ